MKIILSPSKTADWSRSSNLSDRPMPFPEQTSKLVRKIQRFSKTKLQQAFSISDKLVEEVYSMYKSYDDAPLYHAFASFNGLVYKQLNRDAYTTEQWHYIEQHVRMLDALHGLLEPGTLIKPYRMDMKTAVGRSLYTYWDVSKQFTDELIINLASKEFSVMVQQPMITIEFYQCKNGRCVTQATYSKAARGQMLDYLITNQVKSIDAIRLFDRDNYRFDESLSTEDTIAFSRN